jgi:chromate reductase, NAD(P)H dehydrogenase (quinone)
MATYKVGYFVGSLSSKSINRILSRALIRLAPDDLEFTEIPISNLPIYSPDFDDDYPPEATSLKEAIRRADAVLFVTPEYNRSIPGGLKNAIDWPHDRGGKTPLTIFRLPLSVHPSDLSGRRSVSRACAVSSASAMPAR